jgi:hypothetical protein
MGFGAFPDQAGTVARAINSISTILLRSRRLSVGCRHANIRDPIPRYRSAPLQSGSAAAACEIQDGAICNFTRISTQALQRLLGPEARIEGETLENDTDYLERLRSGGLRALYSLTGIKPAQFDFARIPANG